MNELAEWAADCLDDAGMATGPLSLGLRDGDLGAPHRVCPRTEAAFGFGGSAVADPADFYGDIVAGARLDGSVDLDGRTELFGRLEAVRYQTVIGALSSSYVGLGHTSLGASHVAWSGAEVALAVSGKVVLPTAFGLYRHSWPFGLDVGPEVVWTPGPLEISGGLSLLGSAAATVGPVQPRLGLAPSAVLAWHPVHAFELAADVRAGFLYEAPVDEVTVGGGARFAAKRHFGIELEGLVPLAGRARQLAAAQLRASWRFE